MCQGLGAVRGAHQAAWQETPSTRSIKVRCLLLELSEATNQAAQTCMHCRTTCAPPIFAARALLTACPPCACSAVSSMLTDATPRMTRHAWRISRRSSTLRTGRSTRMAAATTKPTLEATDNWCTLQQEKCPAPYPGCRSRTAPSGSGGCARRRQGRTCRPPGHQAHGAPLPLHALARGRQPVQD
jgi:hypothetical protein